MQVFFDRAMSYAAVGSTCSFKAYAIRSDGAYEDVTKSAAWLSSDSQILRPTTAGSFYAGTPGLVDVGVRYESFSGGLAVPVVRPDRLVYPLLSVSGGDPQLVGATARVSLAVQQGASSSPINVTNQATWSSADPSIVKVEGGSVTGVGVGTTSISATYAGLSVEYGLSVHPRR